jgi:hypothetical protein
VIFNLANAWDVGNIEAIGRDVIPAVHAIAPQKI